MFVGLTFVFGYSGLTRSCGSAAKEEQNNIVGVLDGEPVSGADLRHAQRQSYVQFCFAKGVRPENTEESFKTLRIMAWRRLASLRAARKFEIRTGDKELREAVVKEFSSDGTFNERTYIEFQYRIARNFGITMQEFEEYLREHITLTKLRNIVGTACWVPPFEFSKYIAQHTDSFTVDYVVLPPEKFASEVEITDEDAKAFFEANTRIFMEPDKVRVRYVSFPVTNFLADVTATEREAMDYYESHEDDYVSVDTNEVETVQKFEEVKDGIVAILKREKATDKSEKEAMNFVMALAPDRNGEAKPFEQVASAANLSVSTSAFFGLYEQIPELGAYPDFNREAFDLVENDPERYFSNPVTGRDAVFVLAVDKKVEAHIPEFDAVLSEVWRLAEQERKQKMLTEKAEEIQTALKQAVRSGSSFADAVKPYDMESATTETFTWFSPPTNAPSSEEFLESVVSRQQGELTEPIPLTNGIMLAYVSSRTAGEMSANWNLASYIGNALRQQRSGLICLDWEEHLVAMEDIKEEIQKTGSAEEDDQ